MNARRPDTPNEIPPARPKRLFTPAEANRAIVLIEKIVADVMTEYSRVLDLQEMMEAAEREAPAERREQLRMELLRSAGRLRTFAEELEDIGVELKDWSLGVVDFPSLAGGRQVCLSWRHGDRRVRHWHEVSAGLAGLQPIETLPARDAYVGRRRAARDAINARAAET